jgi:hypothetical protein
MITHQDFTVGRSILGEILIAARPRVGGVLERSSPNCEGKMSALRGSRQKPCKVGMDVRSLEDSMASGFLSIAAMVK